MIDKPPLLLLFSLAFVACQGDTTTDTTAPACPTWYADADEDGYGDPNSPVEVCVAADEEGNVENSDDCDDQDAEINPEGVEVCDIAGFDEDCDGFANDEDSSFEGGVESWPDSDGDGFGDGSAQSRMVCEIGDDRSGLDTDCDDSDSNTYPGAAYEESRDDCMTDADQDGYGEQTPAGAAVPGTDCDDSLDTVFPGAKETLDDGIDQNCDNAPVDWAIFTDFETGDYDPNVIGSPGLTSISDVKDKKDPGFANSGRYGVELRPFTSISTVALDTTVCENMLYTFAGKRGGLLDTPDAGEFLRVEAFDGAKWNQIYEWEGDGRTDAEFTVFSRQIRNEAAQNPDFRLRFKASGMAETELLYVDDIGVSCSGPDKDGDGFGRNFDCDDTDARHWSDCGLCVDADNDGYGLDCDLGDDCDDADAKINPVTPDTSVDGIDQNCDGFDGPGMLDTFESGDFRADLWNDVDGNAFVTTEYAFQGDYSLNMYGASGTIESTTMNMSACSEIGLFARVQRGPEQPDTNENLDVDWNNGSTWVQGLSVKGRSLIDPGFVTYEAFVDDSTAFWPGFKVRVQNNGSLNADDFFVDDFAVVCDPIDADGDGFYAGAQDCDDDSPNHWLDCGDCIDLDGDDYGEGCDLGADCDDNNIDVNPEAVDVEGDKIDSNCNGLDGAGFTDDFETGELDPSKWTLLQGTYDDTQSNNDDYSLRMSTTAVSESIRFNTTTCDTLEYEFFIKRGPSTPSLADKLYIDYWDGSDWEQWIRVDGGQTDGDFIEFSGFLTEAEAIRQDTRFRLRSNMNSTFDAMFVDDIFIRCGPPDNDNDGFVETEDCDDTDPAHWSDCGLCLDGDGDDHGVDCDLGEDCDDSDPGVNPGIDDPFGDGIDVSCDGFDGNILFDDFDDLRDADPEVWATIFGDVTFNTFPTPPSTPYNMNFNVYTPVNTVAYAETVEFDASDCPAVYVEYDWTEFFVFDGSLTVSYWDGTDFEELQRVVGQNVNSEWRNEFHVITDPLARTDTFFVRFEGTSNSFDDWMLDNIFVACTEPDSDGDGFPGINDCDEGDANHWSDCGLCVDNDGDDFGIDCDLGADCDDGDAGVNPGELETDGDGVDSNCDGFDSSVAMFDDFDTGAFDDDVWASIVGTQAFVVSATSHSGDFALELDGGGTATTEELDTSSCSLIVWKARVRRGPNLPETGDDLIISYDDGVGFVEVDRVLGQSGVGDSDGNYPLYFGEISDSAAFATDFRMELFNDSPFTFDEFHVDDFGVGCSEGDVDGDGFPDGVDCNDSDIDHWLDCGRCIDSDGDDYGVDCDLGPDCDDADAGINPGVTDTLGDGIDQDCSGVDGSDIYENFDTGTFGGGLVSVDGNFFYSTANANSGAYSLYMGGGIANAYLRPMDLATCPQLAYEFHALRGSLNSPETTDFLWLQGDDGGVWNNLLTVAGNNTQEVTFTRYAGSTTSGTWLADGVEFRVRSDGSGLNIDDFLVDDIAVGCDDDQDRLATSAELALYFTDETLADTDADKVDDGTEIANGTDPLDPADF
ncbi:MAG: putative metal-binding motif-containing protein [Myxococcales bacterium]|nr:putative metal-binding motif-containing protein [Myxococcales bacterium]